MTINEYWEKMFAETENEEEWEEVAELEDVMYRVMEDNFDDFTIWACEEGIDLDAEEMVGGHEIKSLTLWCWDMCGE